MLPFIPLSLFIIEFVICLGFGLHLFGDSSMRRLGELTLCVLLWMVLVRLLGIVISFLIAARVNHNAQSQSAFQWLRTIMMETASVFFAFSILIPLKWFFAPRLTRKISDDTTIVLLVHGLISNSGIWWLFARRLRHLGTWKIDSIDLGPPFQSIDLAAQTLHLKLQHLSKLQPSRIILIGHSMGGLAARQCLSKHSVPLVKQVITLGSPHQGSISAKLLPLKNLIEMRPDSEWLKRLAAKESEQLTTSVVSNSIYSIHDNLVIPFDHASHAQMKMLQVTGMGHLSLLFDRNICRAVAQMIGTHLAKMA